MSGFLSSDELKKLKPAETSSFPSPIPTQIVSSDEFFPQRQNKRQREVEARLQPTCPQNTSNEQKNTEAGPFTGADFYSQPVGAL